MGQCKQMWLGGAIVQPHPVGAKGRLLVAVATRTKKSRDFHGSSPLRPIKRIP